jgi:hypothetical protein
VYRHASLSIGENILIFGGVNEFNEKFNELYLMNLNDKKWTMLMASGNYPTPRTFHNICLIGKRIYVFGGFSKLVNNDCYSLLLYDCLINGIEEKIPKIESEKDLNQDISLNLNLNILLKKQVDELKQKYETEVSKNICKICFEQEINTVIFDCCHRFVCYDCSFKCSSKCPACKGEIKSILKTYN